MAPLPCMRLSRPALAAFGLCLALAVPSSAAPVEPVRSLAAKEKAPLVETLKGLVSIESGSGDREGLDKIADLIAGRLKALGGAVEMIEPGSADIYHMVDTPKQIGKMVQARFTGTGTSKIMLIAHMDTVYLRGMLAQQPFRIDGNRAYGLGIADDKHGIAVILHTLAILKEMNFRDYGLITILINGDEEVSSPGSRAMLTRLGGEHDVVFSCEGARVDSDQLSLTTAGIGAVVLNVKGRASHAGSAPERGRNALYELAHQILQTRDLSNPETGLKMNWTIANAGTNRNVIPANASATADVRVLRVADYDGIERQVRERIKSQLIPDTSVEMTFERRRPPLEATPASRALAKHAQGVYGEIGDTLIVRDIAEGGGTDAAFAALRTKAAVIERFGLRGFGAHSNDAEYVDLDSIEPRLYLLTRMIMDVSQGKTN
ncbi:MAG TPA: M20/M25/M40 family metallo-hydrolase [Xanthobacteraceae bacterium]|nr:M20/M25/M40 family metallo-hydrolase [Xanthobacteraceae bacterium]